MAYTRHFLRLLPCLVLVACGNSASNNEVPVPSGEATSAVTAPAAPTHGANASEASAPDPVSMTGNVPPASGTTPAQAPAMQGPLPASVAKLPGIACVQKKKDWSPECTAGEYRISVYADGCSGDGFYGRVYSDDEKGVTLQTAFAPFPTAPVAKLREAQFVCVAADARKPAVDEALWYYVTAIPAESVKACAGKAICGKPGKPTVEWMGTVPSGACRLEHGQYVDCAAGWVSAAQLEEFSNGL